ncbi:MBL fold metallo-hydrolase [soil metagenome]
MVRIVPIEDRGLGNTSYLVDLGDGSGLVVDPERDPRPYLEAAKQEGLVVRHVAETHLHADFVSGAREFVALGASLIAPRGSHLAHPHRAVGEGDHLQLGDLTLRVLDTPGHTPEHVAYLLHEGEAPLVLFSGGTLMAGGVARPDLISPDLTLTLAHQAYQSVRRLLDNLPDEIELRPTHGGGSFCSSAGASESGGSTVGSEKRAHPAMTAPDAESFVSDLLAGLGSYPPYFRRLREVNREGPKTFGIDLPRLAQIGADDLAGRTVVDVRPIETFANGHIAGAVSIALRDEFGTWLGWLFDPDTPLVFMLSPDQDERNLVSQALNIGYENLAGRIDVDHWVKAGNELATIDLISADQIATGTPILDVRQTSEWELGHVPSATHIELGDLRASLARVKPESVVHCGHGQRAMTAASILAKTGTPVAVNTAGQAEIARAVGGR